MSPCIIAKNVCMTFVASVAFMAEAIGAVRVERAIRRSASEWSVGGERSGRGSRDLLIKRVGEEGIEKKTVENRKNTEKNRKKKGKSLKKSGAEPQNAKKVAPTKKPQTQNTSLRKMNDLTQT